MDNPPSLSFYQVFKHVMLEINGSPIWSKMNSDVTLIYIIVAIAMEIIPEATLSENRRSTLPSRVKELMIRGCTFTERFHVLPFTCFSPVNKQAELFNGNVRRRMCSVVQRGCWASGSIRVGAKTHNLLFYRDRRSDEGKVFSARGEVSIHKTLLWCC